MMTETFRNRSQFIGNCLAFFALRQVARFAAPAPRKGGVDLPNGGNLYGTGTPHLMLANVQPGDSGWYSAVATNALGGVTSAAVSLTVVNLSLTAAGPGLGWLTNRQFNLRLGGGAAWPVSVKASTNLFHWLPLKTLWVGPESTVFTDPAATNYPVRAYRAQPVP